MGYYHIYNRGVAKQDIFLDRQDYTVFLYFLKSFLLDPEYIDTNEQFYQARRLNYHGRLRLHAYCLMPNHFHLFVSQINDNGISKFMQSLGNAYSRYFNEKYERVGPVFQGKYKAAEILDDRHYIHLSRYIHQNPISLRIDPEEYEYSSCRYYLDTAPTPRWIFKDEILDNFKNIDDYRLFMQENKDQSKSILDDTAID